MKKFLAICFLLSGCMYQQSNITAPENSSSSAEKINFITSLMILDCSYRNQGCENVRAFTECAHLLNQTIKSMSDEQINMLEKNLRTQYGFEKSGDDELNDIADKVLAKYLQCKK